jgi:Beta-ketoacyl synthase, N-terminal domain
MSALCAIAGVGVYTPGFISASAFIGGTRAEAASPPQGALLDKHSRRRASELTKAFADVYKEALEESGLEATQVAAVFGSALGEANTTIGLLDQLWRGPGALSPMRFAASVHNTAAGVVSIGTKNTGFTTAIGADHDTPAMALLEAVAFVVTHDTPVIVACGDEAAPANLVRGDEGWDFLTCAVVLLPLTAAAPGLPLLAALEPSLGKPTLTQAELPRGLAQNPEVGLLDLISALRTGQVGRVRLDRGRGRGYCAEIVRTS